MWSDYVWSGKDTHSPAMSFFTRLVYREIQFAIYSVPEQAKTSGPRGSACETHKTRFWFSENYQIITTSQLITLAHAMNMDERFNICLTSELQLWQEKNVRKEPIYNIWEKNINSLYEIAAQYF